MIWAVSVTLLQLVAALGLALLLNSDLRLQGLTRVLALIPWAMPPVVVAIMWKMIYSPNARAAQRVPRARSACRTTSTGSRTSRPRCPP